MSRLRDLSGQRFGKLTAVKPCGKNKYDTLWLCRCDCGIEKAVSRGALTGKNGTHSCGCLVTHEDLSGRRFGELVAIRECGKTPDGKILWECLCDCGQRTVVRSNYLKIGHTKTCGKCKQVQYEIDEEKKTVRATTFDGIAFVFDIADFEFVKQYHWYALRRSGYIVTPMGRNNVGLHTLLLNPPKGKFADHINRVKQDNRRCNLRIADKQGNAANVGLQKNNKSGAKGVDILPNGRFKARIGYNHQKISLGSYDTINEAAQAYDNAARFYFGEFACTNEMITKEIGDYYRFNG